MVAGRALGLRAPWWDGLQEAACRAWPPLVIPIPSSGQDRHFSPQAPMGPFLFLSTPAQAEAGSSLPEPLLPLITTLAVPTGGHCSARRLGKNCAWGTARCAQSIAGAFPWCNRRRRGSSHFQPLLGPIQNAADTNTNHTLTFKGILRVSVANTLVGLSLGAFPGTTGNKEIAPGQSQGLTLLLLVPLTQSSTDRHCPQGAAGSAGNSARDAAQGAHPPPSMKRDWRRRLSSPHIFSHWGVHVWRHQNMKKASQLGNRNTEDLLLCVCVEFFSFFYNECELLLISES